MCGDKKPKFLGESWDTRIRGGRAGRVISSDRAEEHQDSPKRTKGEVTGKKLLSTVFVTISVSLPKTAKPFDAWLTTWHDVPFGTI